MTVQGFIEEIGGLETFSEKFALRRMLINRTTEKYDPHVQIDFINKASDGLERFNLGEEVIVHINVSSRQGKDGRWWPSIRGWKIEPVEKKDEEPLKSGEPDDDLPF